MEIKSTIIDAVSEVSFLKLPRGSRIVNVEENEIDEYLTVRYVSPNSEGTDVYKVFIILEEQSLYNDLINSKYYGTFKSAVGNVGVFMKIDRVE